MVGNAGLALTFTDNSADGSGNIANIGTNNGNTSTINLDASRTYKCMQQLQILMLQWE